MGKAFKLGRLWSPTLDGLRQGAPPRPRPHTHFNEGGSASSHFAYLPVQVSPSLPDVPKAMLTVSRRGGSGAGQFRELMLFAAVLSLPQATSVRRFGSALRNRAA